MHETKSAMLDSEVMLRAFLAHPTELMVILQAERDHSGAIKEWVFREANTNLLKTVGFTRETLLGRRLSDVYPQRAALVSELYAQVLATREPVHYEIRFGDKEFAITLYSAGPDMIIGTCRDITELRRTEATLRESEERFRELANNIDQFAWTCDELGQGTWYNDRWYEYTGTTFEQTRGEGWKSVHDPAHLDRVVASLARCLASGQPWEDTFPLRGKDGQYHWFLSRAVPIRDDSGRVVRWFGTNTDVTELRSLQETLKDSSRRKDEFLAMLAHELRNPVAPIYNAAEVLLRRFSHEEGVRSLAAIIRRQAGHLSRILDDLLDVARITQGRIELRPEVVAVSDCIEAAAETVESLIRQKGHQLTITETIPPLLVNADKVRLEQCLANLLTNAAKYTNQGGEIRVRPYAEGAEVVIEISDTGIGISPEFLPRAFELFSQSKLAADRSQGGLGIGLSICKQLIEMHGGSVNCKSDGVGRGSTFTIRLPLVSAPGEPAQPPAAPNKTRRRVLIVDDNTEAADTLATLLRLEGHETRAVYSAKSALAQTESFAPEIALLDIGMPQMDGYELARRLKTALGSVCLIAVSGYGQPEDKQRSAAAGFAAHLVKPVDMTALRKAIAAMSMT